MLTYLLTYGNAEVTTLFTSHARQRPPAELSSICFMCFVAKRNILQAKVSEEMNMTLAARNRITQLLTLYTNPERHNVQRYRQADRLTDR